MFAEIPYARVLKCFVKALYFTALTSAFGGIQVGAIFVLCIISTNMPLESNIDKLYDDGFWLFFSVGIVSTGMMEFFVTKKVKTSTIVGSLLLLLSLGLGFCSILIYSKIFLDKENMNSQNSRIIQNVILLASFYLSFVLQYVMLSKEYLKNSIK